MTPLNHRRRFLRFLAGSPLLAQAYAQEAGKISSPVAASPKDVLAVTEYRRYTDTSAGAAAGAGSGAIGGGQRAGGLWRISLHAYGDADNLHLDMTSAPPLSQEDIVLLLTIGMTRAEVSRLRPSRPSTVHARTLQPAASTRRTSLSVSSHFKGMYSRYHGPAPSALATSSTEIDVCVESICAVFLALAARAVANSPSG